MKIFSHNSKDFSILRCFTGHNPYGQSESGFELVRRRIETGSPKRNDIFQARHIMKRAGQNHFLVSPLESLRSEI